MIRLSKPQILLLHEQLIAEICRREQTYRRTCYAGVPRLKWDRITAYADRTVRGHPAISGRHPSIH